MVMALQFGVDVVLAENFQQARLGVARETNKTAGEFRQLLQRGRTLALLGPQLHAGDQAAQILITFARFHQQRISAAVGAGDFRADVRANAGLLGGHVEARRAIDAVAVHKRHGGHVEIGAGAGKIFRH